MSQLFPNHLNVSFYFLMRHTLKEANFIFSRLRDKGFCFCFCLKVHVLRERKVRRRKSLRWKCQPTISYFTHQNVSFLPHSFSHLPPLSYLKDHSVNNIKGTVSQFSSIKTQIINQFSIFFLKRRNPLKLFYGTLCSESYHVEVMGAVIKFFVQWALENFHQTCHFFGTLWDSLV